MRFRYPISQLEGSPLTGKACLLILDSLQICRGTQPRRVVLNSIGGIRADTTYTCRGTQPRRVFPYSIGGIKENKKVRTVHNASPSPDRIRLGPKGPSVYMASRSKAPVTTEGVYPYVVRHTGYLREVWCVNTEKRL